MALVEAWLWNRLKTEAGIVAIAGTRTYALYAPQNLEEPFITFRRVSTQRSYTSRKNDGIPVITFDINCWVKDDYAQAKQLANAVRIAVDGYRVDTVDFDVRRAFVLDESDITEPPDWGRENPDWYGVQITLEVCHTETVPTYT